MKRLLPVALVFASAALAAAQGPISPFGSYKSFGPDVVDRSLLGVQLGIPVYTKPTLNGGTLSLVLNYDSSEVWTTTAGGGAWVPVPGAGWYLSSPASATLASDSYGATCGWYDPDWGDDPDTGAPDDQSDEIVTYNFTLTEPDGTAVPNLLSYFVVNGNTTHPPRWDPDGDGPWVNDCPTPTSLPESQVVADGKGFSVSIDASGDAAAYDRNGDRIDGGFTDPNGNSLEQLGWSEGTSGSATAGNYVTYSWPGPNNTGPFVQEDFIAINVSSDFSEGTTPYSGTMTVPSDLKFPDGSTYTFTYTSDGRLATITLPTGGVVSYSYGAISITDFGSASLTRSDNVTGGTWNWTRADGSGGYPVTTETTPDSNNSVYTFGAPPTAGGADMLNEVDTYQGAVGPNNLLQTVTIADTPVGAMPTQQVITTELATPGGTPAPVYAGRTLTLDAYGDQTGETDSDWGPNPTGQATLRTIATPYEYAGNGLRPASTLVEDGAGNPASQSAFFYDSHGNLQSENDYASPSAYLTKSWQYNPNGTVGSATDTNGAVTDYSYGSAGCGLFPTEVKSVAIPAALDTTMSWDCAGGVPTSSTDVNAALTQYAYSDPLWRPTSITAPDGSVTTISYTVNVVERAMAFNNGGSTDDVVSSRDGLGRRYLTQKRQALNSGSFDTVETFYDALGRVIGTSLPCSTGEWQPCSQATTTRYDALSRVVQVTDAGGGETDYTYPGNDVDRTVKGNGGSSPDVGKQEELDGLGRLSSVCELGHNPGTATCWQHTNQNGFWTIYTRNGAGQITQVEQNAQGNPVQWRSYQFDELGRLSQETNPESGTTNYSFDVAQTACPGQLAQAGDLTAREDANGTVTCYAHDPLHRVSEISYPTLGSGVAETASKYFVYDGGASDPVDGAVMANAGGRLSEAYTGAPSAKITDLGFGYNLGGEVAAAYQRSPGSGGWYVGDESFQSGYPAGLSATGLPGVSYGLDGEGRLYTASVNGSELVQQANYTAAGQPLSVEWPSGDSDTYVYGASGRMSVYQFSVNRATDTGALTWNGNGTLETLQITDGLAGAGDTQTCNYAQDNLGRVSGISCTSGWSQNLSFDGWGNLSKIGTQSFEPDYGSNNRIVSNVGITGEYDDDGDLLNDPTNASAPGNQFDAEGKAVTLAGVSATFDALGRVVEAGGYEVVYAPGGGKLAIMNGQTLVRADLPLPGGGEAVYSAAGLQYFRHGDWLGSARLETTPGRTLYSASAYAPYGEAYGAAGASDLDFTGMKQDTAAGNYDFLMREYNVAQGRWWTPDPAGLAAVDPSDPQSWNRYAYVNNQPLEFIDPFGLTGCASVKLDTDQDKKNAEASGDNFGPYDPGSEYAEGGGQSAGCAPQQCSLDGVDIDCGLGWDLGTAGYGPGGPGGGGSPALGFFSSTPWYEAPMMVPGLNGYPQVPTWIDKPGPPIIDLDTGDWGNGGAWGWALESAPQSCGPEAGCYPLPLLPSGNGLFPMGGPGGALQTLVRGYSALMHPIELAAANLAIVTTGAILVGAGAMAATAGCVDPTPFEPATCAGGIAAGGFMGAVGAFDLGLGAYVFQRVTWPAIKGWGGGE